MGGVTATAAFECAAKVSPVIGVVASVESAFSTSIVGGTTAAALWPLLALVLLLATLAALCLTSLIGLLWVLWHAYRGGWLPSALHSIRICPCMALMKVLLLRRLS